MFKSILRQVQLLEGKEKHPAGVWTNLTYSQTIWTELICQIKVAETIGGCRVCWENGDFPASHVWLPEGIPERKSSASNDSASGKAACHQRLCPSFSSLKQMQTLRRFATRQVCKVRHKPIWKLGIDVHVYFACVFSFQIIFRFCGVDGWWFHSGSFGWHERREKGKLLSICSISRDGLCILDSWFVTHGWCIHDYNLWVSHILWPDYGTDSLRIQEI